MTSFQDTIRDVYWTFVLPGICIFSILTNILNTIVFSKMKTKNHVYKLMLYNSVANLAYLLTVVFVFIIRCGQFCQIKDTYLAKFYTHYIYMYTANSISLFSAFIEVAITIQRYFFLTNRSLLKKFKKKFIFGPLLVFAFVFYLPQLSTFEIKLVYVNENVTLNTTGEKVYVRENIVRHKKFLIRNLLAFQTGFRLLLIVVLIFFLNFLAYNLFKKYESMKAKETILNVPNKPSYSSMPVNFYRLIVSACFSNNFTYPKLSCIVTGTKVDKGYLIDMLYFFKMFFKKYYFFEVFLAR